MEPRLLSRGNVGVAATRKCLQVLQWSHGFSAVETVLRNAYRPRFMKPQWSHGFSAVETLLFRTAPTYTRMLQCSHGFSAVETAARCSRASGRSRFNGATASQPWKRFYVDDDEVWTLALQWSHGFSAVETSATSRSRSR